MPTNSQKQLSLAQVFQTWWPLAVSWLLMALESPLMSAVIARLPQPEKNLAAWGGVVFPLALLIEAPVIMLLAASTALSKDWKNYQILRKYMMIAGASLTLLHFGVAFTPLFDFIVVRIMNSPAEIIEPARIGLRIMLPWTWSIAYRRFNQGVLIRFGHSKAVGLGTLVRLTSVGIILAIGSLDGSFAGIVVATAAIASGVLAEAAYTGLRVRGVLRDQVKKAIPTQSIIELRWFVKFYIPLAMTSMLTMLMIPMGSAAMSRMPRALESLAAWPVLSGLVFMHRSIGMAFNEVMVALLDEPKSYVVLSRFRNILIIVSSGLLLLIAGTSISQFWFQRLSALSPQLVRLARMAIWFTLPIPAMGVLHSFYQGILLNSQKTRGITEAMGVFLVVAGFILALGILWQFQTGVTIVWVAFSVGSIAQYFYLSLRSRAATGALILVKS